MIHLVKKTSVTVVRGHCLTAADLTGFVRWRAALALLTENRRDGPLSFTAKDPRKRMAMSLASVFRVVPSIQVLPGSSFRCPAASFLV